MSSNGRGVDRILGILRAVDGKGAARIDTGIGDLWSAITDPARLARWYAQVEGDLRLGGEIHIFVESNDWRGTGRVDRGEPPGRLQVTTRESDESWCKGQGAEPFAQTIEAKLTAEGDQTVLAIEVRGMPLGSLLAFGAGWQIHAENLAAYLAGRDPGDIEGRWDELLPVYRELGAHLD